MEKREVMIKNLVCPRYIYATHNLMNEIPISYSNVVLGKVTIEKNYPSFNLRGITSLDFEILKDK